MKKPFDPFDPENRYKRTRRSKETIELENKLRQERLLEPFQRVLNDWGNPLCIRTDWLLSDAVQYCQMYYWMRRNCSSTLGILGYEKVNNPNSKDGRWKSEGKWITIYGKIGAKKRDILDFVKSEILDIK